MNASFSPPQGSVIEVGMLIVGGGPAGLAPLVSAGWTGSLDRILSLGVIVAEQGPAIGAGSIGKYAINSDSTAETLVSGVCDTTDARIAVLRDHPATLAVAAFGAAAAPLSLVGAFMAELGKVLHSILDASPGCGVFTGHTALDSCRELDGRWRTRLRRTSDGAELSVRSRLLVLATGASQPNDVLARQKIGGVGLLERYGDRIMQSDEMLTAAGLAKIESRVSAGSQGRVAIIGSSSSAIASARAVLQLPCGQQLGRAGLSVLHRRPLRLFYPSVAAALAEGYDEFGPDDICPLSGFVFRFAGFRLDSRELVMAARGIGGRTAEQRLHLHRLLPGPDPTALAILDAADVIIVALGYRPRGLPIHDAGGTPTMLQAAHPDGLPMVDDQCRVLNSAGKPVLGLLGIGLAAGFASPITAGGEPSFSGQTNGLWQWQHHIGALIARQAVFGADMSRIQRRDVVGV